jgi:hypothetical protein
MPTVRTSLAPILRSHGAHQCLIHPSIAPHLQCWTEQISTFNKHVVVGIGSPRDVAHAPEKLS